VACGGEEFADEHNDILLNPVVIVEILSASREAYDRGQKFAYHRQIPSLREYLLVSQHKPLVEQFIRQDNGDWLLREVSGLESKLSLTSIAITIEMAKIYANVRIVPAPPPSDKPDHRSYF
jgi:Uma2 family endonuclease